MNKTDAVYILIAVAVLGLALHSLAADLPIPALTPGVTQPYQCSTKTTLLRNVTPQQKAFIFHRYGLSGNDRKLCPEGYEIDHLISLELGGSNDTKNLWPQLYCGTWNAHMKDRLENKLHHLVCVDQQMSLPTAQSCISTDWIKCYKQLIK